MNTVVFFFLLGIVFFGFELFVPGTVMGVIGFLSMVAGCGYAFGHFGLSFGALACGVALALTILTVLLEFVWLPHTRFGRRLFLTKAIAGTSQPMPADAHAVVGKEAEALTILAPSGYVCVDGRSYEAFCQDGHVDKGARLLVRSVDRYTLSVTKIPSIP